MRVMLSTIGSRGDVQPLVALGVALHEQGHGARLCAPPDFEPLAREHGLQFVPVGPPVRAAGTAAAATAKATATGGAVSRMVADTVAAQFAALGEAAGGCDVLVACNQIQLAAATVAQLRGMRYVFADFSPISMPSPHHPPVPLPGQPPTDPALTDEAQWEGERARRHALWAGPLNEHRAAAGLAPVADVTAYILTDRPLLAADPALAPWPTPSDLDVRQTGAWLPVDRRPLPDDVLRFLDAGEPPVCFGFGSIRAARAGSADMLAAARAAGRRAIVSRGWADLDLIDAPDCLAVTEVNLQALFPRLAAVVHHGGAGTTTTAARAGVPQVVVPHRYDQAYFAGRVEALGLGVHGSGELAGDLDRVLRTEVRAAAEAFAPRVEPDGARRTAAWLGEHAA